MNARAYRRALKLAFVASLFGVVPGLVNAEPATPALSQWNHRAWRAQQGAPTEVVALAQTTDGYLWLGTGAGLFRFDGTRFEEFKAVDGSPLPSLNISTLLATADGGLLVGYRFGGVSRLDGDRARHFLAADGMPTASVYAFAEQADGVIWAATLGGLMRFDGSKWERIAANWGYESDRAYEVFVDTAGSLWVDDGAHLQRLRPHQRRFEATDEAVDRAVMRQSPVGTHWMVDAPHRLRALTPAGQTVSIANWPVFASPNAMLFDRDGDLWVAGYFGGVKRVRRPDAVQTSTPEIDEYRHEQGLTSDFTLSILQDREGTIWVGTKAGLDQLRRPNFVPVPIPKSSVEISVAAGSDGKIWVGSGAGPVVSVDGVNVVEDRLTSYITCANRAPDGTVWLAGPGKLWRSGQEGFVSIDIPATVGTSDVQAMAVGPDDAIWVSIIRAGLFRYFEGRWVRNGGVDGLPMQNPLVATSDTGGRLWFGYADNRVSLLDHGRLRSFDRFSGVTVGNVSALAANGGRVWVGGERGLAFFDTTAFVRVRAVDEGALTAISGIVEMPDGDLWVAARNGVYRIDAADLRGAIADPLHRVSAELFDFSDGLPGVPAQHRPLPSAVLAADGRLWVLTPEGLAWIDPTRISRNAMPPPIAIETLRSDEEVLRPIGEARLKAGTRDLSIGFTALSLARPERVLFRYRLSGSSDAWSAPSARREAFFTNLGPGHYRFDVIASNDSGVWNLQGATLSFEIAPLFWQTIWFRVACAAVATLILYGLYLLRMREISLRLQQRLQERFSERERIARELHDTLLQSVQGLMLQFRALTRQGSHADPRALIERALEKAEVFMIEGRNRVAALRERGHATRDFAAEMRDTVRLVSGDWDLPCTFRVEGEPRVVDEIVQDDLIGIVREALFNAFRHADATVIVVVLRFDEDHLTLQVIDDGRGIPHETLAQGELAGHFGLQGMRERAGQIGARLEVMGGRRTGTVVEIVVPAHAAYHGNRPAWWALTRRPRGGALP